MCEVSPEASTARRVVELSGLSPAVGGSPEIVDLLCGNCLGDAGVHCSSLSIESCFCTAIRMN
jgi:hypothetical protein